MQDSPGYTTLLFQALLNTMPDPVLIFDADWHVLEMNPPAESALRVNAANARRQTLERALRDAPNGQALIAFARGQRPLAEWASDDQHTFAPRIQPLILNHSDAAQGWLLLLRDISQLKKLNTNQNEFIRIVSHDLRSPLTSMQGFASMLELGLVGELNEKQGQFVEKILAGIAQITALVENIQDAGRFDPETGFYEMSRSLCDVRDLVSKITSSHLVPAEKQELTITVDIADDVPIINADVNMLERAITNLVDNAIKYTPNGGHIEVFARRDVNRVIIGVRDDGLGIPAESLRQLFQRHVRLARQEHKKIKGSGLGLFIVKSVAQRHGGEAWVESREGVGSTFSISIPLEGENIVVP